MENIEGLENNGGAMIDTKELREFAKRVHLFYNNTDIMHNAADELDALRSRVEELKGVETSLRNQQQAFESQLQYNIDRRIAMQDELASLQQQLAEARELAKHSLSCMYRSCPRCNAAIEAANNTETK